jgi:hypothetical protein
MKKGWKVFADAFNTSVLTTTENLNFLQQMRGDVISILREAFPTKFSGIRSFKPPKLCGP